MKELIGRKMEGFSFDGKITYNPSMDEVIGVAGTIVDASEDLVMVQFNDDKWAYPTKLAKKHLLEKPKEKKQDVNNWMTQLQPILDEFKDGDDTPLDGDEVDDLCRIIKAKINLNEGNITASEYTDGTSSKTTVNNCLSKEDMSIVDTALNYAYNDTMERIGNLRRLVDGESVKTLIEYANKFLNVQDKLK